MRRVVITWLVGVLMIGSTFAQIPKEAFDLTNSLSGLWHSGETDKAVETSLELYRLHPPMFIDRIHNTLAQQMVSDSKQHGLTYLEKLYRVGNVEINEIIAPVLLWSRSMLATDQAELRTIAIEMDALFGDSSSYVSCAERYGLLLIQELEKRNAIDVEAKGEWLKQTIKRIETYPFLDAVPSKRDEAESRAWHRYLLAYSYFQLYSMEPSQEAYLKKASDYSPDLNDRLNKSAYFYDAGLLTGNPNHVGYKSVYQSFLIANNRQEEALDLLCEIVFGEPTDANVAALRSFYASTKKEASFAAFWEEYVHKQGKAVPKVKLKFEKEVLNLPHKTGSWIYMDVWGTWCGPCRRELPELQELYAANQQVSDSKVRIYTLSYFSQNLSDFMTENKYTFPVCEIDQKINDLFEVSGYPTKILITPGGHFIKMPFGVDWRMYLKNYVLL